MSKGPRPFSAPLVHLHVCVYKYFVFLNCQTRPRRQLPLTVLHLPLNAFIMGDATRNLSKDFYTEVLVIGGGFRGTYALHKFRQAGLPVKLVGAGVDFGGVWQWTR